MRGRLTSLYGVALAVLVGLASCGARPAFADDDRGVDRHEVARASAEATVATPATTGAPPLCPQLHEPAAHVGSIVVFVQYVEPYVGEKWAALMLEDPRACPPTTPPGSVDCANLKIWKRRLDQTENATLVLDDATEQPVGHHVYTGDDNKIGVPHDPTGLQGRTWHLWGEAPCEAPTPCEAPERKEADPR